MMMLQLIGRPDADGCVVECWVGEIGSLEVTGSFYVTLDVWKTMVENQIIIQFQTGGDDPPPLTSSIDSFQGEHQFLSNFHPATVRMSGVEYRTVEHAYQAAKTKDPAVRENVRAAINPGKAKRIGKTLELRPDWEEIKLDVMTALVRYKFRNNPVLPELLLATGIRTLVEGNDWGDQFWGACKKGFDGQANWEGANHLGLILMKIRGELRDDIRQET